MNETRQHPRGAVRIAANIEWRTERESKLLHECMTVDLSEGGMAVEMPGLLPTDTKVIVHCSSEKSIFLATVRYCRWNLSHYYAGLQFVAKTNSFDPAQPAGRDLYGMLRLSREADPDQIDRVYRTLVKRYHPDNPDTGDAEAFLSLSEAYRILSNPGRRGAYDKSLNDRNSPAGSMGALFNRREFFAGLSGERIRRFAVLCLLYRQRVTNYQFPGLSAYDMERLTGCTNEEAGFTLWYLCEKGLAQRGDSEFSITSDGVDHVERHQGEFSEFSPLLQAGTLLAESSGA